MKRFIAVLGILALMKAHRNDDPWIDPDFMWRLPPDAGLDPKIYLKYRP